MVNLSSVVPSVLYDSSNGIKRYFGEVVPQRIVDSWRKDGKKQLVGQADMLRGLVNKLLWKSLI